MPLLLSAIVLTVSTTTFGCFGFVVPLDAVVLREFAPISRWAGHWGVDIAAKEGSDVHAIGSGVVRFVGIVVGNRTVSIDHGGGLITAYSYLAQTRVAKGDHVTMGQAVGVAAIHGGQSSFHLSLRERGRYVDPLEVRRCLGGPARGLYLAVGPTTYAGGRARDSRRHFRSATQRSYRNGARRSDPTGARRRACHASR